MTELEKRMRIRAGTKEDEKKGEEKSENRTEKYGAVQV